MGGGGGERERERTREGVPFMNEKGKVAFEEAQKGWRGVLVAR